MVRKAWQILSLYAFKTFGSMDFSNRYINIKLIYYGLMPIKILPTQPIFGINNVPEIGLRT